MQPEATMAFHYTDVRQIIIHLICSTRTSMLLCETPAESQDCSPNFAKPYSLYAKRVICQCTMKVIDAGLCKSTLR